MRGRRSHYLRHKEAARAVVHARIAHYVAQGESAPKAVRIRNVRSRWGSCSQKGNLNFHYKIAFLPPHLVDYVVVHELCHLREFNHSARFWALVAARLPDWKARKRELLRLSRGER